MRLIEAVLAVIGLYSVGGAVVTRAAWLTGRKPAAPAPAEDPRILPDPPTLPTAPPWSLPTLTTETELLASCDGCHRDIAVPTGQTVLMATGSWWNVEGICPDCSMPWISRPLTDAEADAMRAVGVVDGQAAVEVLRLALATDDAVAEWLSP